MDATRGERENFERKLFLHFFVCLMMKDLGGAWTRLEVKEVAERKLALIDACLVVENMGGVWTRLEEK